MIEPSAADLARRLAVVEDRLAIYNLLASHPVSADAGLEHVLRGIYTQDATFDRGEELHGATGIEKIVAFAQNPAHHEAMNGGLAHFNSPPLVELQGDTAVATNYIMLIFPDTQGDMRELPNHGVTTGFRVHRVVANRWTLVRDDGRWRIAARSVSPLDGSEPALKILARAGEIYSGDQDAIPSRPGA